MKKQWKRAVTILMLAVGLFGCGQPGPRTDERNEDERSEGWIGVYVQDIDREMQRYLELESRHGVLVNNLVDDSPAEDSGLQKEDVIIEYDGKKIRRTRDLTRLVRRSRPGDRVKLKIIRNDDKKTLRLRIGERPERYARGRRQAPHFPIKPQLPSGDFQFGKHGWLGVRTANLDEDLAAYFDVGERGGVLVLSVVEDSPAEEAGLKAGDVILEIDGERVHDSEELVELLHDKGAGDRIKIEIKRKGKGAVSVLRSFFPLVAVRFIMIPECIPPTRLKIGS